MTHLFLKFSAFSRMLEPLSSLRLFEDLSGLGVITDLMDMSLSKLQELVMDRTPGMLQSMGSQKVGHD